MKGAPAPTRGYVSPLFTLHPALCTLHFTIWTMPPPTRGYASPFFTLHPALCTLHPALCTLHFTIEEGW